ncbi:MAG TPA: mannosyltransferase family protein [Ktedonobacterales bacterium]
MMSLTRRLRIMKEPDAPMRWEQLRRQWSDARVWLHLASEWLAPLRLRYGWVSYPVVVGLAARLAQVIVATFGVRLLAPSAASSPLDLWYRWDASWYLAIAKIGYGYSPTSQSSVNFFPLFPLLINLLARPLSIFHVADAQLLAGMLLAWGCFIAALVVLYRLALDRWGVRVARGAVALIAAYPFGYFFGAPYTESLYLLLCGLVFLGIERRWWWLAGVAAMLGSATRSPGLLLGACAVLAYALALWERRIRLSRDALWLTLSPLGAVAYAWYCAAVFRDPFAYLATSENGWHRGHLRWDGIASGWDLLLHPGTWLGSNQLKPMLNGTYAVLTVLFLLLLIPIWRRLGPVYAVVTAASVIVPIATTTSMVSQGRYLSTAFPAFLVMGLLLRDRHGLRDGLIIAGAIALGLLATFFALNLEVY